MTKRAKNRKFEKSRKVMMAVVVRPELREIIEHLVSKGLYKNFSSFFLEATKYYMVEKLNINGGQQYVFDKKECDKGEGEGEGVSTNSKKKEADNNKKNNDKNSDKAC